ncbi:MAG: hypothetical protein L3J08_06855 [Flavobacteriaceae bacterium]|nr:hypothetical protein [Flavobacteriaceae bacterium]
MKLFKNLILMITFTSVLISCNKDDEPLVSEPTVSYTSTEIEAVFFETGSSEAPTVNWNNNEGSFSLASAIEGLSIDSSTGALSWTKTLPNGEHDIEILAKNSAGQTSINVKIKNILQGEFVGLLSYDREEDKFKVKLSTDGKAIIKIEKAPELEGTWTIKGDIATVDFTVDDDSYSLKGKLTQTEAEVTLIGDLLNFDEKIGTFNAVLQELL